MKPACLVFLVLAAVSGVRSQGRKLEIYWVDVEGGGATLIVSPSGESLLVDTGFPGERDAHRIQQTANAAGLSKIDMLVITHYHGDHVGGAPALSQLIPIGKYYDHGESIETSTPPGALLFNSYKALAQGKRTVLRPGDKLPLPGVEITIASSNGEVIGKAINGGGPNSYCKDAERKDPDTTENSRSLGFLLTYGKFKFLDLGDLTWDREMMLACPIDKLGTVSLFQATHHGFSGGRSGAPALVWALQPQVVVVNDGARKGFDASAYEILAKIPGVEGIWQLHRSVVSDAVHNTSEQMTANLDEGEEDHGLGLSASASEDGAFTITNSRNRYSKTYPAR